jgi:tRNA A37 methylthiotransferase MiaB
MRRFGSTDQFLDLLASIRALDAAAGARSNVIVGFPGETDDDITELRRFLVEARLDAVGVFGYSDEDGTEAADLADKVSADVVRRRESALGDLAEELVAQRAEERIGSTVDVLVESVSDGVVEGRAAHQAPEVDGTTTLAGAPTAQVGDIVSAVVIATDGADLVAEAVDLAAVAGAQQAVTA